MDIRKVGLNWLEANFENFENPLYASKFYSADEAWSKEVVWWLEIPLKTIQSEEVAEIILLCEKHPGSNDFHFLLVPTNFITKHLVGLYVRSEKVSLYLSADPRSLFREKRGSGSVNFAGFELDADGNMQMPNLTVAQYSQAIDQLSFSQQNILEALYYSPHSSATAKELAVTMKYVGYQASNRQIGQIGKSISISTGIEPPYYQSGHAFQPGYYLLVGPYDHNRGWVMWQNMRMALEDLKLVEPDRIKANLIERLPTEASYYDEGLLYEEGKLVRVFTNKYERNKQAREACLQNFGYNCAVCDFNFGKVYGDFAIKFIHVHHIVSLSAIGQLYTVHPLEDLIPVCANCHSAMHLIKPALTVNELKDLMKKQARK